VFFLGILSIQCKIRRDRPTDTWRSTCWPPLAYGIVNVNGGKLSKHQPKRLYCVFTVWPCLR